MTNAAQHLAAPVRRTATALRLPTAAATPVIQQRGPGRRPKSVVNLVLVRRDRRIAEMNALRERREQFRLRASAAINAIYEQARREGIAL